LQNKLLAPAKNINSLIVSYDFDQPFIYLTASIYNIKGQKLVELFNNTYATAKGEIVWNLEEKIGYYADSGAYIIYVKVKSGNFDQEYKEPFYIPIKNEHVFKYKIKFPAEIDIPGQNLIQIVVEQLPIETRGITATANILGSLIINVPYPGKYIELGLTTKNANKGEPLTFTINMSAPAST